MSWCRMALLAEDVMTTTVRNIAVIAVNDGRIEELKALVSEMHAVMREKDPGTVGHDWFVNEAGTEVVVLEEYRSAEDVARHLATTEEFSTRMGELGTMTSVLVCGQLPDEMRSALEAFQAKAYRPFVEYNV